MSTSPFPLGSIAPRRCAGRLGAASRATLGALLLAAASFANGAPTRIHGRVTSHFSGAPFTDALVEIADAQYRPIGAAATDGNGAYAWDGDCPDEAGAVCHAIAFRTYDSQPHDAAVASFANGAQDAAVDLQQHALAHLSGRVRGLTAESTYVGPIVTFRYDAASSSWQRTGDVQQDGFQTLAAFLPEGRYRLCVGGLSVGLQRQCFDHQPQAGTWAQQAYTDIVLAEGETRVGVDFDLAAGGNIAGAVIDAPKGAPLVGVPFNGHWAGTPTYVSVDLIDANGERFDAGYAVTDALGSYTVGGTPAGTFRVQIAAGDGNFRDTLQAWPGIVCPDYPCPPDAGTPITTLDHGTVSGIDIALHPRVTIRGTVTDAVTHQPLAGVAVGAWRELPNPWEAPPQFDVYWTQTDAQGRYVAYAAPDPYGGTYVVAGSGTRLSAIYPDTACANGAENLCRAQFPFGPTPAGAVALALTAQTGDDIAGIDFALQQGGAFSGMLRDAGGAPLYGSFAVYDANGTQVSAFFGYGFDAFGNATPYQSPALPPGTYYASATDSYSGPCQVYAARRCPAAGESILGVGPTPIVVSLGQTRGGVDFAIPVDGVFSNGFDG